MNDIRVRAWDTENKHMLSWLMIRQTAFNYNVEGYPLIYRIFTSLKENHILMLYSGLKDNQKFPIYESDYLIIENEEGILPVEVIYEDAMFKVKNENIDMPLFEFLKKGNILVYGDKYRGFKHNWTEDTL